MSDAPVPAHYEAEFRACLAEAAQDGRVLMDRMVNAARQSLQTRDTAARDFHERNAISHALHLLGKHGPTMVVAYPLALEAAFAEAVSGSRSSKAASAASSSLSFDQLELMDESQVQDRVAQARAQQVALHGADQDLAELNPLICAVQGLKTVQPERNPMRPDVYIKALQEVIEQTRVSSDTRLGWMQHMCPVLGKDLSGVYQRAAERLRASGIRAAGYAVLQTPSAAPVRAAPAAQEEFEDAFEDEVAELQALEEELLTVDKLRSLLAGELDGAKPLSSYSAKLQAQAAAEDLHAGHTGFASTVPAALDALHQMNQVDEAMQRMAQRHQGGADPAAAGGRQDVRGVSQALGAEVVSLMVENIANDQRLLAPVQKAVRDMEPALIRLARIDPRFFSDKEHPARRLLDEVTQRSLAYESVEASGFGAFLRPLQLAVGQLAASTIESAQPFEAALEALSQIWGDLGREERRHREKAVKALLHAEQRNLLAEKIRSDILSWPDTANVPAEVMDFVCGPWAQVMAEARLSDRSGAGDPGGYSGLVPGLLWSAQPALARNNLAKLTKLIPVLLTKLREGLKTINYPSVQASAFFEALIGLHQRALEAPGRSEAAARPKAPGDWRVAGAKPSVRAPLPADSGTWLAPQEAAQSGFMEMEEAFPADAGAKSATPGSMEPATVQNAGDLAMGSWVELLADGQWVRTQLTWASPHGTLFLFTNAAGGTQSMTRRLLDKMLAEGGMRVVSLQPLVDGALDAVAQTAMRNSVEPRKG